MTFANNPADPDSLLRRALRANVLFSTVCGTVWIGGGDALGRWFGRDGSMASDGIGLLIFAGLLAILSTRPRIPAVVAAVVVVLDVLWVLDAATKVANGAFSTQGGWVMGAVALVVLAFAALQALGIQQGRQARQAGKVGAPAGA